VNQPVIIDANSLITRCIMASALTDLKAGGVWTGGVYGTLTMLRSFLSDPDRELGPVYAFFDCGVPEYRLALIPGYKSERKEKKKLLSDEDKEKAFEQLHLAREMLELLGVTCLAYKDREADDCVAAASRVLCAGKAHVPVVWSSDKDLLQTVRWGAEVCNGSAWIDRGNFEELVEVPIQCYVLYKTLVGDKSDSIPGAGGVGPVRAIEMIKENASDLKLLGDLKQLEMLVDRLKEKEKPHKHETAVIENAERLRASMKGIMLMDSFGATESLKKRMMEADHIVDKRGFLTFCKRLLIKSVLGSPNYYIKPFQDAAARTV
jgi:5'-3' exonuclease